MISNGNGKEYGGTESRQAVRFGRLWLSEKYSPLSE
jgi:hypothetical protein